MSIVIKSCIVAFCFFAIPFAHSQSVPQAAMNVSLVQLIATPEKFDGKLVFVFGFLEMNREGDLLFLHQSDSEHALLSNAIWVRRTEEMGKDRAKLNMKYVKVVGTFRAGFKEQLGIPSNGIPDVKGVTMWSDPSNPRQALHSQ